MDNKETKNKTPIGKYMCLPSILLLFTGMILTFIFHIEIGGVISVIGGAGLVYSVLSCLGEV